MGTSNIFDVREDVVQLFFDITRQKPYRLAFACNQERDQFADVINHQVAVGNSL
jgi:hypothetical protein